MLGWAGRGMETEIISIRVDAAAARAFLILPEKDRRKLEALLSIRLAEAAESRESLGAVMKETRNSVQTARQFFSSFRGKRWLSGG